MEKTCGTFDLTKDGITLHVNWDKKNYKITSTINGIQLTEYGHMMLMMPKFYTEQDIREKCIDLIPDFLSAYKIITENKEYFSEKEKMLLQMQADMHEKKYALNEKKRELKRQLKNGTLPKKEYDEKVTEIQFKKDENIQKIVSFVTTTAIEATTSNSRCYNLIKDYLKNILNRNRGKQGGIL